VPSAPIVVQDKWSTFEFTTLSPRELLYERLGNIHGESQTVDLGADYWCLARISLGRGTWFFRRNGQRLRLADIDSVWLYKPPFAVMESFAPDGLQCKQEVYISRTPPPAFMPPVAVQFAAAVRSFPRSLEEVRRVFSHARHVDAYDRTSTPSPLARKAKALLDAGIGLGDDVKIGVLAKRLQTSPEVLGRAFQRDFGVTPVAYRGETRALCAIPRLTSRTMTVLDTAIELGYNDANRFSKQFHQYSGARARDFIYGSAAAPRRSAHERLDDRLP
jgi:AraC-like DNA-binding protein